MAEKTSVGKIIYEKRYNRRLLESSFKTDYREGIDWIDLDVVKLTGISEPWYIDEKSYTDTIIFQHSVKNGKTSFAHPWNPYTAASHIMSYSGDNFFEQAKSFKFQSKIEFQKEFFGTEGNVYNAWSGLWDIMGKNKDGYIEVSKETDIQTYYHMVEIIKASLLRFLAPGCRFEDYTTATGDKKLYIRKTK